MSVSTSPAIGYEHWSDFLYQLGAVCGPAELQGALVGQLCGGQRLSPEQWQAFALAFMDLPSAELATEKLAAIAALYSLVLAALSDGEYRFQLLLPDDALPLLPRAEALSTWCQGFLHGLGSAGGGVLEGLSADSREALDDIAQIAELQLDESESEENEVYFAELVEYIRVATLAMFAELSPPNVAPLSVSDAVH